MAAKTKKTTKKTKSEPKDKDAKTSSFAVAKSKDGTIQITFTIPYKDVDKSREKVLEELGKNVEVPGFRKGKAPLAKVAEHVKQDTVIQHTLNNIIPELLGKTIKEEKLQPAIYPRFELVKAQDNEPWEIRAITCELPNVKLGDYKKELKGKGKAKAIWTPEKGDPSKDSKDEKDAEPTKAQREQVVIETLLETTKLDIPKILIDEEVNNRLSRLLERIEKLGLDLDSYLASVGKNTQTLRGEYQIQAKQALALDLILSKVAEEEKISIEDKELDQALNIAKADPNSQDVDPAQQKAMVSSILKRRKAVDKLISYL